MTTKDKKSGTNIQRLVFGALVPSVVAASAQEQEQQVSQTLESLALKDEKYKDSPMDIVFPTKKSYFSEKDLEVESLEGPSKRGGSAAKATPKKHLRDPKTDSHDELEDPGVLQAYQVSGPAAGLPNGSGASLEDDNTLYFVMDRVKKAQPVSVDLVQKNTPAKHGGKTSRRAKKRVTAAEGEHVEVRTRKAKADSNEDPPGIVLGGNGVVWIDGSGTCVQGTSSFVKSKCDKLNLGCCDEDDSCSWPSDQTATVCKNSCTGPRACEDIGDGAVIEKDSCQGFRACNFLAKASTTGKIRVGKESCTAKFACFLICLESEDCELTIGDNACTGGNEPCRFIGGFAAKKIMIGDRSCRGLYACSVVAIETTKNVMIGSDSCVGLYSCYRTCADSERCELTIGDKACQGIDACYYLGAPYETPNTHIEKIDIMYGACDGIRACYYIGANSESIKVGKGACQGTNTCRYFGYEATKKVEVGDYSCDGVSACRSFALKIGNKDVKVDKNECIGNSECSGVSNSNCFNTAKVPNKDGLCPAP